MEPARITDPSLLPVQNELSAREPIFHRPEFGTDRASFEGMMGTDFWEVGASGNRYSREFVLDVLEQRYAGPFEDVWETKDFYCQCIAPDTYLLTYTLLQGPRITRRGTLWQRTLEGWKILYHQGTVVESA